jgi:hypothetical protein
MIEVEAHGTVAVISVEDLIADRMGQYASGAARNARTGQSVIHPF